MCQTGACPQEASDELEVVPASGGQTGPFQGTAVAPGWAPSQS